MSDLRMRYSDQMIDLFADDLFHEGRLTVNHAASPYGLPVFVRDDGTVLGPAECGRLSEAEDCRTAEYAAFEDGEAAAADSVSLGRPWTARAFTGRRYRPEVAEVLKAAQAAGYDIGSALQALDR